ncbi:DUF1203 domain-containing protein [Methylocapsa sp. S129]|uniref:DUF1203 domain-containing protein n=1 Tax=Methylocapsa sp. S129 TaxID=1641869 RepID=UPI00131B83C2|nr:DUF1203 domain-containing protein [Methylocapsa sp. S129]
MTFQIRALDQDAFLGFFAMSDGELANHGAVRRIATAKPGFPCRVSLADAEIGDELILINHMHQPHASPYRASHAIFVRKGVETAKPMIGETPQFFRARALSLRAFDSEAMIVAAELMLDGENLGPALDKLFDIEKVSYVHIHFAKFGCYAARADRV